MSDLPGYLTTAEAATELGLTVRRVRQLAGDLGAVKVGRDLVFPVAKVKAMKNKPRPKRGWPKGRPRK